MKIFIPAFGRVNTQCRDGSTVRFIQLAKRWLVNGVDLLMLISEREVSLMEMEGIHTKFYILPDWIRSEKDTTVNVFLVYLMRLIQSFIYRVKVNFDVIYATSDFVADVISGVLAKVRNPKAKLIVCIFLIAPNPFVGYRNVWGNSRKKFPTFRGIMYFLLQRVSIILSKKYADRIFVLCKLDKDYLKKFGLYNKTNVVDMGVSLKEISKVEVAGNFNYDGIFIGRFHTQKGIDDLINIWRFVCDVNENARLAVIGGGADTACKRLKTQINSLNLQNNIDFLGFQTGDKKFSLLKGSRLFLMPSYYESWGLVAIEAMGSGLPVIAYNLPIFDVIFSGGMIKVKIGDIENFAKTILSIQNDEALYKKLHREAIEQAKRYDWDVISQNELSLF